MRSQDLWDYIDKQATNDSILRSFFGTTIIERKLIPWPLKHFKVRSKEWNLFLTNDPKTSQIKPLIYEFIKEALSPVYDQNNCNQFTRRKNLIIYPERLPALSIATLLHAIAIAKGVNFDEYDKEMMGRDYDIFCSTKKPTTSEDRRRKVEIHKACKEQNVHFLEYETVLIRARKFYLAYVLMPSCTEAAAEYDIVRSNMSHQTDIFRLITRL